MGGAVGQVESVSVHWKTLATITLSTQTALQDCDFQQTECNKRIKEILTKVSEVKLLFSDICIVASAKRYFDHECLLVRYSRCDFSKYAGQIF